ncbi:MAG: hypothetical protein IJC71_08405 [Clostridia bacterium]|nr:hypothetical protein [Clostridia bacterium]
MHEKLYGNDLLLAELSGSFAFFLKEANDDPSSHGYGLVRDKSVFAPEIASIASVGYGLAALVIGEKRGWITKEYARKRAEGTLDTFLTRMEAEHGFFYHFVNLYTAQRAWNSEISIIDTAIFLCGAITAGEYFGGAVKEKAELLYRHTDWNWYTDPAVSQFSMGYKPERGFWGHWDFFAEQLMLYVLGAGSPAHPIDRVMYDILERRRADYGEEKDILYSWGGSLFTYQFSHAWIDFRNLRDEQGIDWFENSVKASRAARQYCIDRQDRFRTFGENAWGLTACVGPHGYSGSYGAKPSTTDVDADNDGTVAPCGAAGSIVFTPRESMAALAHYWNDVPGLRCVYGLRDAYNLDGDEPWIAEECIGIDKGITLVMIENALTGLVWDCFMQNSFVQNGLKRLGFHKTATATAFTL